jgi:hypothetical protein
MAKIDIGNLFKKLRSGRLDKAELGSVMEFVDTVTSKVDRFSIGMAQPDGVFYISIPVSNRMVDYEEYYELDESTYMKIQANLDEGAKLAAKCRLREMDDRLILKPGSDRGMPS